MWAGGRPPWRAGWTDHFLPPPRCCHPTPTCSCVLMCHTPKKEYYKKFLFEPLPGV